MTVIATCNGRASWGYGAQAAREAQAMISRALQSAADLSEIVNAVFAASRRARAEFAVPGADAPAFSVLVALVGESAVEVAWIGDVDAWLEHNGVITQRIAPHVFIDGNARVVTRPLPGERAWEREPFLERATWTRCAGDRFVHG